jgi:hypothetical protein
MSQYLEPLRHSDCCTEAKYHVSPTQCACVVPAMGTSYSDYFSNIINRLVFAMGKIVEYHFGKY